MYLDLSKIFSYNAALAFIVLKRGYGKSYGFKCKIIDAFLKTGERFIWCRRNKPELKDAISKFTTDICDKYKDHTFKISKNNFYIDDKLAGYFIPLSTTIGKKSVPYNDVTRLIYDEFIPEGGYSNFIPDEPKIFASFIMSVFRSRKMKVYLLGNKDTSITPYNIYFNIPPFDGNVYLSDRNILIYSSDRNNIIEPEYEESDIVKVLKGTSYLDYSLRNSAYSETNDYICKRTKNCRQLFIINIDGIDLGVYIDNERSRIIFDDKCDISTKRKFCFNVDNLKESYFLFSKSMYYGKMIKDMLHNGRLYFTSNKVKSVANNFIKYIG